MELRPPRGRLAFLAAAAVALVVLGLAIGDRRAGRLDLGEHTSVVHPAEVPRPQVRVARFADGPNAPLQGSAEARR